MSTTRFPRTGLSVEQAFSFLALALQRLGRESTPSEFPERFFRVLSGVFGFNAAWWARGMQTDPARSGLSIFGTIPAYMADCASLMTLIQFSAEDSPGVSFARAWDCRGTGLLACDGEADDDIRMRYALHLHAEEPHTRLTSDMILWRGSKGRPFEVAEQRLMRALGPHLVNAWCSSKILQGAGPTVGTDRDAHACAMADAEGCVRIAPEPFQFLLRQEFPHWRLPELPADVARILFTGPQPRPERFVGNRIVLRVTTTGDTFLLRGRYKRPLDSLTEHELNIARLAAEGLDYRDIATSLNIAPATARNHLSRILSKTRAGRRTEVAAQLADLE